MQFRSPLFLLRTLSFATLGAAAVTSSAGACATSNGDNAHGPDLGPLPQRDASIDGKIVLPDGNVIDPDSGNNSETGGSCTGTVAVLAGDDGALGGSVQINGGAWSTMSVTGGAAKSKPALVAFGAGFLGVTHGAGDVLQTTSVSGTSWTGATTIGASGVKGPPSLAALATSAHVVYSAGPANNHDFTHGIHNGTGWNAATGQVGPPLSFGTVSAGLAGVGSEVFFAENGTNNKLYVRSYGTSWSGSVEIPSAPTIGADLAATPELVALDGAMDLMVVYVEQTTRRVSFSTRNATSKAWSDGANINMVMTTDEKFSLSRTGSSSVLVAFRGQDGKGYYSAGAVSGGSIAWSPPSAIGPAAVDVAAAPAVAKGICGDDAVVAYSSGGSVSVTRLRGTSWSQPESVTNLNGQRVAVATRL